MMKNSFLKFLVVPHGNGEKRWVRLPIIFLFFGVLIIILIVFFFINNLGKYVDVTSIAFLRTDNKRLKEKVELLAEKRDSLQSVSDSLLKEQRAVKEKHYLANIDTIDAKSYSLDTLIMWEKWIDSVLNTVLETDRKILSKVPSILPVKGYIVKHFGEIVDPFTEKKKPHMGINILAPMNSPVISAARGKVTGVKHDKGKGLFVEISHWGNIITLYGHLLSVAVSEGDSVEKGQIIGYVGQSGRAPYPYLYYEVKRDSININPEDVIFRGL